MAEDKELQAQLEVLSGPLALLIDRDAFVKTYGFSFPAYIAARRGICGELAVLADRIQHTCEKTGTQRAVGGGIGIAAGLMGLAGIALAPVSGGTSLALTVAGAGAGVASAGTSLSATFEKDKDLAIAAHQAQECLNAIKHKDEVVMGFLNDVSLSLSKLQGLCKEFGAKMVFDHLNRLRNIGMGVVAKGATAGTLATTIGANIANLTTESASLASAPGKICGLSVASAGGSIAKGISSSLALIGIAAGIWDIVEGTKDINGGEHVHAYRVAMAQVTIDTDNIMFAIRGLLHSMNVSFAISGVVQSGHNGFGLDVAGASTRGGAKVLTWPIHCGLNQLWDHWHEGYLMAKMTGLVLDARSMTMQPLQEGDKHQMWIKGPNNTLRNKASDKVLDICGESKEKGAQLCVWEAHGGTNQEWAMEEEVFIKSCKDGKVLDIAGASQAEGAEVIAYDQHFGYNQQWRRTNDLLLVSKMHSMCLEVEGGEAKPGQPVRMRKVTHADKQMFRYRDGYLISLLSKDLVLEISKEGRLVLGKKTGSLSQKWKLL